MIIIPIKWLFHWEYTLFSDKPTWRWLNKMSVVGFSLAVLTLGDCQVKFNHLETIYCCQRIALETSWARFQNPRPWKAISLHLSNKINQPQRLTIRIWTSNFRSFPDQKLPSRISVTETNSVAETAVKDDPGSTSRINRRDMSGWWGWSG